MCGIVGIIGTDEIFTKLHRAAGKLQHRGTDGVGSVFSNGINFISPAPHRVLGEVPQSFNTWPSKKPEDAHLAVIHIRYGTSGDRESINNTQPFVVNSPSQGLFCLAHNGDTQDVEPIRARLEKMGVNFTSDSDSEVLAQLIACSKKPTLPEAIISALENVRSAYALVLATPSSLIAVCDPHGIRPLSIGKFSNGGYIVASETCTFEIVGAKHVRDVLPGEVVVINRNGFEEAAHFAPAPRLARCVFESAYFSDPTSQTFGIDSSMFRHRLGRQLAKEYLRTRPKIPKETVIIPVPNSAYHYAEGFSHELWHPLTFPISRINRSARSFIGRDQADRMLRVLLKSTIGTWSIYDKDCLLIDDSLVRGNTMRAIVALLKDHGAKSVSVLIGSPPITHPCLYGIDFKDKKLLHSEKYAGDITAMTEGIGADELFYISLEGFYNIVLEIFGATKDSCFACFDGNYAL